MENVKQWAMVTAISAAAGAVVLMLAPDGSLGKSVRTAVSLFLVVSMLSPFIKGISFESVEMFSEEKYEQPDLNGEIEKQMKTALTDEIEKILKENGIKAADIDIDMVTENGVPNVKEIEITVESGTLTDAVKERIRAETGVVPEVRG